MGILGTKAAEQQATERIESREEVPMGREIGEVWMALSISAARFDSHPRGALALSV